MVLVPLLVCPNFSVPALSAPKGVGWDRRELTFAGILFKRLQEAHTFPWGLLSGTALRSYAGQHHPQVAGLVSFLPLARHQHHDQNQGSDSRFGVIASCSQHAVES